MYSSTADTGLLADWARGEGQQPRVLLALQHPVDQFLQVERGKNPPVGGGLDGPQEPQHHPSSS